MPIRYLSGLSVDSTVLVVDAVNDRVGIGTASPAYKLDVQGSAGNIARITDGTSHFLFYAGSGLNEIATTGPLLLTVSGSERMRITSAGNVGIGTTAPYSTLTVGITDATAEISSGGPNTHLTLKTVGASGAIRFFTIGGTTSNLATTESMRIAAGGNVGIGTTNTDPLSLSRERNLAIVTTGTNAALTIVGGAAGRIDFGVGSTRTGGIYSDSSNYTEIFTTTALPLVFSTNSAEKMRITSDGSLLVGATNPDIGGSVKGTIIRQDGSIVAARNIASPFHYQTPISADRMNTMGDGIMYSMWREGVFQAGIGATNTSNMTFFTGDNTSASERMRITAAGNVGIGTTNPEGMLTIGTTNPTINLGDTGVSVTDALIGRAAANDYHVTGSAAGDLTIRPEATKKIVFGTTSTAATTGVARMTIDTSGNVGIGTTSPAQKLQVDGNVYVNDDSTTGNGIMLRGADRPLIARGWDPFTSGNKLGVGRWGVYMESAELFIGAPGTDYSNALITLGGWLVNGTREPNLTLNNSTQRVGIGTTSPGGKLEVNFTAAQGATALILRTSDGGGNGAIRWQNSAGTNQAGIGSNFNIGDNGALEFLNGNTTNMIIRSSGNVGIGTTAPAAKLHLSGAGATELRIASTTGNTSSLLSFYEVALASWGIDAGQANGSFFIKDLYNSATRLTILNSGNVGIGTTSVSNFFTVITNLGGSPANLSELEPYSTVKIKARPDRDNILYIGAKDALTGMLLQSGTTSTAADLLLNPFGGNVGIGTTAPATKFHVEGGTVSYGQVRILSTSGSAGEASIHIGRTDQTLEQRWTVGQGVASIADSFGFYTGAAVRMTLTTSGNVGIGTTNPAEPLVVSNGGAAGFEWSPSTGRWYRFNRSTSAYAGIYTEASEHTWSIGGSEKMRLSAAGSVGINTTSPTTDVGLTAKRPTGTGWIIDALNGSNTRVGGFYSTGGGNGQLYLANNAGTETIVLDSAGNSYFTGGNVGIGTTNPTAKLHSESSTTSYQGFFYNTNTTDGDGVRIRTDYQNNASILFNVENAGNDLFVVQGGAAGVGRVLIPSGNVGIGTTAPVYKLDVAGDGRFANGHSGTLTVKHNYSFQQPNWGIKLDGDTSTSGGYLSQYVNIGGFELAQGATYYGAGAYRTDANSTSFAAVAGYNGIITFNTDSGLTANSSFTISERMRITAAGNVGIGTTGPSQKLEVVGKIRLTDDIQLWSANPTILWESGALRFYNNSTATERMRITSDGNVGIGTTGPTEKLHVDGSTLITYNNSFQSTNSVGNKAILARVSPTSGIVNYAEYATATNLNGFVIGSDDARVKGNIATDSLEFITNTSTRMTILSSGNVGINTTTPGSTLHVIGDVLIQTGALGVGVNPNATDGRIDASNDIVAFSTSDRRLKENITPIANALEKVRSLTGVEFDWKEETKSVHGYEGHDVGVIAQDVQAVLPEAVRTNDSGYLSVRYEKMIALLVEAMKEQQAQIDELKKLIK